MGSRDEEKPQYPPQGGECRICCTLFVAIVLSVLSAVTIIYASVIVYIPSLVVIESNLRGPKTCTTQKVQRHLEGEENCDGWSSCEEWCLGMSNQACSHVYASVRDQGVHIQLNGCDINLDNSFVNQECSTLEDLNELNCKLYKNQTDENGVAGAKDDCMKFDQRLISCESGVCKDIGLIYKCDYKMYLQDIKDQTDGDSVDGFCNCNICTDDFSDDVSKPVAIFETECTEEHKMCAEVKQNETDYILAAKCSRIRCANCWNVCHGRQQCLTMNTRRDPPALGTDEWGRPHLRYYHCVEGRCEEVYDLKCERTCSGTLVNVVTNNVVVLKGETIISARCDTYNANPMESDAIGLSEPIGDGQMLVLSCTGATISEFDGSISGDDCVNGTWIDPSSFGEPKVNYSSLVTTYQKMSAEAVDVVDNIPNEVQLTLTKLTRVKINPGGCVDTLSKECEAFYENYGSRDGRNHTSKAIYPCFYDPAKPEFVVTSFDKEATITLLYLFTIIPCSIFVVSCTYICCCNKVVYVADDGRMRVRCCGRFISGIGNVNTNLTHADLKNFAPGR